MKKNNGVVITVLLCIIWAMQLLAAPAYSLPTQKAWYWTGGEKKVLPGRSFNTARSIFVTGGDVYVAGTHARYPYDPKAVPCYWKNGVKRDLSCGSMKFARAALGLDEDRGKETDATAIAVEGGSVYVTGHYFDDTRAVACLWKDGRRIELPAGKGNSHASALLFHGGRVYIAGDYHNGTQSMACYWIDGVKSDLESPPVDSFSYGYERGARAMSLFLRDGDPCAAGWYTAPGGPRACYWSRGALHDLPLPAAHGESGSRMISWAHRAAMVKGGVIVLGKTFEESGRIGHEGCRWDDDGFHGTGFTFFTDLAVSDGRLYTLGRRWSRGTGKSVNFFAVDGRETQILRDVQGYDGHMAIFVDRGTVYVAGGEYRAGPGGM